MVGKHTTDDVPQISRNHRERVGIEALEVAVEIWGASPEATGAEWISAEAEEICRKQYQSCDMFDSNPVPIERFPPSVWS